MDEPARRAWSRPELIVLVRSGPEETVLSTCKVDSTAGEPGYSIDGCDLGVSGECNACASIVGS